MEFVKKKWVLREIENQHFTGGPVKAAQKDSRTRNSRTAEQHHNTGKTAANNQATKRGGPPLAKKIKKGTVPAGSEGKKKCVPIHGRSSRHLLRFPERKTKEPGFTAWIVLGFKGAPRR